MSRLLLLLAVVLALTGCGEEKKPDTPAAPDASIFDKKEGPRAPLNQPAKYQKGS